MDPADDAIPRGAGHKTLTAGLHPASGGDRVGPFEQAASPGGAVKTGTDTMPGYWHERAAVNLPRFAGSAFFKAHGADLAAERLQCASAAHLSADVIPDGSWLGVSTDRARAWCRGAEPLDRAK